MAAKLIRKVVAPVGDWFRLTIEHVAGKQWVHMTRVVGWAVVGAEGEDDHVEGIDSGCSGDTEDHLNYSYVYGSDLAPNGKTWLTVFNDTPNSGMPYSKDVSDIVKS